MTQKPTQFCPECGTPTSVDQRFCSNCGSVIKASPNDLTVAASNMPQTLQTGAPTVTASGQFSPTGATHPNTYAPGNQPYTGADPYLTRDQSMLPPPPTSATYNPYAVNAPGGPQTYEQNQSVNMPPAAYSPPSGTYNPVPSYAQARKSNGCLVTSLVLLLILAVGVGGFIFLKAPFTSSQSHHQIGGTNGTAVSGGSNSGTATQTSDSRTERLDLKLTFASIQTTIVTVQFAKNFADDSSTTTLAGIVRLNLHEVNNSAGNPRYLETDVLLLVLPDGTTVQSTNQQQNISPDAGVSRDNWIDFALNHAVRLDQLTLRFGTPSQQQMNVPLQATANLSKYQDRTSSPNLQFQYNGLDWTLKNAVLSYSYNDKQATTGNLYVIITLSVSNSTLDNAAIFPNDIMRMQAGSSTQAPDSYDFPYSVPSHGTGGGVVGFLVPQGATSFTLILLGNSSVSPPVAQVTQTFQIQ